MDNKIEKISIICGIGSIIFCVIGWLLHSNFEFSLFNLFKSIQAFIIAMAAAFISFCIGVLVGSILKLDDDASLIAGIIGFFVLVAPIADFFTYICEKIF